MRVLVTGDRNWNDFDYITATLSAMRQTHGLTEICHGAARGADTLAGQAAKNLGIPSTEFPANWKKHGRAAGPLRNKEMLDQFKPDLVVAFHSNIKDSKGTKNCVLEARKRDIPVLLLRG